MSSRARETLHAMALALLLAGVAVAGCGPQGTLDRRPAVGHGSEPLVAVHVRAGAASTRQMAASTPSPAAQLVLHGQPRDADGHKIVALTFDADMTQGMISLLAAGRVQRFNDPALMRYLHREHVPATVFMTGLWARVYPDLARRIARDPDYEVENHSWDHRAFTSPCYGLPVVHGGAAARRSEVTLAARELARVAGVHPAYFRFPGGCHDRAALREVAVVGETPVQWDVDSVDAFNPNAEQVIEQVLRRVRPGSIVVMHFMGPPNAPATADAVQRIVPTLRRRGYRLVLLRDLLAP